MQGKAIVLSICIFVALLGLGLYFILHHEPSGTDMDGDNYQQSINKQGHESRVDGTTASGASDASDKSSKNQNKNQKDISKSKNEKSASGANNSLMVVDQTLNKLNSTIETTQQASNILGATKESISIEFTLLDGEENKPLANYAVELKSKFANENLNSNSFTTDASGKFIFTTSRSGHAFFQMFTKDYSIHSRYLMVRYGKNSYAAKMFKGGTLEVKVSSSDNKKIESLIAKVGAEGRTLPGNWRLGGANRPSQDGLVMEYDKVRGIYFLSNLPVGAIDVSFKAPAYVETASFKVIIDPNTPAFMEIRFLPARVITFDLDIVKKPDLIYVSIQRFNRGRGRNVVQTESVQTFQDTSVINVENSVSSGNTVGGGDQQRGRRRPWSNTSSDGGVGMANDRAEVLKNANGFYEYELAERNTTNITIYVDKYVPRELTLVPEKDLYKLSLVEGYVGEVRLKDSKGQAISGAAVNFVSGNLRQSVASDVDGLAQLAGMGETAGIRLNITHKDFVTVNETWQFNATDNNLKNITMTAGQGVSGRVLFGDKPVMNAKILLYQSGNNFPVNRSDSAGDGSYYFSNLDSNKDKPYTIKAFHREFGVAVTASIVLEGSSQVIDLKLVEEKSLLVKLVDSSQAPMANKNITLTNNLEPDFSLSLVTDEKGEYQLMNMMHGFYFTRLEDDKYRLKTRNLQIPGGTLTMTAESKDLRKINVSVLGGRPFKGNLKVSIEMNRNSWPLDVITGEDGNMYLEIRDEGPMRFGSFVFEAQGFAVVRVGPFENRESLPKVFNVEFQEGDNFRVKVVEDKNNMPLAGVVVDIFSGSTRIQSLPTNDLGEITFVHLADKFSVNIKEENFCAYNADFDGNKAKDMTARLIRGGGLKGHLTLGKDVSVAWVFLQPYGNNQAIDSEGNFEYFNLLPGEYSLSVSRNLKDGKNQVEKIPVRIMIENDKTFEINLDDYQKNQTTLDVSVFKDGVLSNERGFLNITDRKGQSVVATEITTGAHKVERILPGEYLLNYNYQGKSLQKTLTVLPRQANTVEIYVPGSTLTIAVKNEEGKPISKVMITLYAGEKYRQEDTYLGSQLVTNDTGVGTFLLMPKSPYYFVVEEDFRFNYQVNVIGPIILNAGQTSHIDYILPFAKKIPKIQVTDNANNPLPDVGFIFNDEGGNFFQRTLKKEWDLYPYSNKNGFLPENCWPKNNFTLVVGKEGYEFKEIMFNADFDPNQPLQIKLNRASAIRVNFPQVLPLPISVGILNKNGTLLQKPIPLPNRNKYELTVYYENISFGNVTFNDLAAGTYFIGYFWNGSSRLILRQGPITLGVEETQNVTSTLQVNEY